MSPYAWEQPHEVNRFIAGASAELRRRGHRVVVLAPSESRRLVRASRKLVERAADEPEVLFEAEDHVLAVGHSVAAPGRRGRSFPLSLDSSRTVEDALARSTLDFVHVHEPFAPSVSSAALRHSRSLNVATFHSASERILSTQVAPRLVGRLFQRLDARTASFDATRELLERYFPASYRVVRPGADAIEPAQKPDDAVIEILYPAQEERSALRLFLRALRRLPAQLPWHATVWSPVAPAELAIPLPRALRERVSFAGPTEGSEAAHLAAAHIVVAASSGIMPASGIPLRAMAAGAIPVASRLYPYEEALVHGERGLLFEPRDVETLAAQLTRLADDGGLRGELRERVARDRAELGWPRVAGALEETYSRVAQRRHSPGDPALRRRLAQRPLIAVDLHMHTDHSPDCATPVDMLLETAQEQGLGAIAVTDHNEISGALAARDRAEGIKVIVAEEVKTAGQGEVIGLFIEELIPRGMSLAETIAEIKRQGGLVYVPHPFDRMHSVPDYEHLLDVVEEIDAIEVFNPRIAFSSFNEEAVRFAAKYRVAAGAGSDSHVAQGLGSVRISMRDFDGPEEFLESLREADIIRRRQSLLYVQALKFIQTHGRGATGRQAGARSPKRAKASVRRAGDKPAKRVRSGNN